MVGDRLYQLRKQHNMSQRDLAEKLAVSHYTVSSYENGRSDPNDDIKVLIARLFDVSLDYLMGLIDEPLTYRRSEDMVSIPKALTEEQKQLLLEFIRYVESRDTPPRK